MMREPDELPKTLRAWRTERLLSTRRLAELAGASNKTIVQLENGRQTASFVTIEKICRVLDVEPRAVREFSLALDTRAGLTPDSAFTGPEVGAPLAHVCCIAQRPALISLARQLLASDTYALTTFTRVPVSTEQLLALHPDVLVIEVGSPSSLELLRDVRGEPATARIPTIVTGHHLQRLEELTSEPELTSASAERSDLRIVPFTRDLRALVAAVEQAAAPAT